MQLDIRNLTALVTGASAGIGRAYCTALAAGGAHIVAVARRETRLHELAADLRARHGIEVTVLVADLSDRRAPQDIVAALAGKPIDILINNAGFGVPGKFLSSPWQVHADTLVVMQQAVAHLSYLLLPAMRERRRGLILNVASLAGFLPGTAGHTLYGAAKAWMITFSESLALEYGDEGVRVCAVCPGFTRSEFHDVTGTRAQVERMPRWLWLTAEEVVTQSLAAARRGDIVFVPGALNRLIAVIMRALPRGLALALSRRQARRFRDTR